MKKILYCLCLLISIASFASNPPVSEKVISSFKTTFPGILNEKWYEYDGFYEVVFTNNGINCRIKYNLDGDVLLVRRDYHEKDLPLFILAKVKAKFEGKRIFGITETTSDDGLSYSIILDDAKHWTTVKSDETGNLNIVQKLKKT